MHAVIIRELKVKQANNRTASQPTSQHPKQILGTNRTKDKNALTNFFFYSIHRHTHLHTDYL